MPIAIGPSTCLQRGEREANNITLYTLAVPRKRPNQLFYVCYEFLKDGNYNVVGTVRDTKNPKKIDPLRKAFGELFNQLTLVEADLDNK